MRKTVKENKDGKERGMSQIFEKKQQGELPQILTNTERK